MYQHEKTQTDKHDKLLNAIENLTDAMEELKNQHDKDYSNLFTEIIISLKEIGGSPNSPSWANKIHHELHLLNKTIIMAALVLGATKNPEKTLIEYKKIIDQYLD